MKSLYIFISIIFINLSLIAQDFQVSNMQGSSVNDPKFTISGSDVYLTFSTNMRVYKFPASGPSSPISNPINPDPNQWGPFQVDIKAYGDYIYLVYTDYANQKFLVKVAYSNNRGTDWYQVIVDTIEFGNLLGSRYDLPKVLISDKGTPYFFYFVFQNDRDTSGIYMFDLFSNTRKKIDVNIPKPRYEYAITPFVKTINNVDNILLSYWMDSSFYLIKSTNEGQTFSNPSIIQTINVLWPFYDWQSTFQTDSQGKLYFKYDYQVFDIGQHGRKFFVKISENFGETWSQPILIDTHFNYVDFRVVGNKFVKFYIDDDMNLYIQSSSDLINWSEKVKVNVADSSVISEFAAGVQFSNQIALAWKDKRTGHDEIFYRVMDVPTSVENNSMPIDFVLHQNYPNPFNPITNISFSLNQRAKVSLKIYDVFGKLIKTLENGELNEGIYNYQFDGNGLSSGVYYYQLISGSRSLTKKMMLIK